MPNTPRFLYRIDTRKPEVIFETGFNPVGNVRDFFTHILGERMRDSYFISTSETITAALRFFASWLDEPIGRDEVYLYEIRADQRFYNARATGENFLDRVLNNQIVYEHGNRDDALFCIDILRGEFAYQREWFSDGPIAREQIVRAWRVDMVEIDPRHVRHTGREFSQALPRINNPDINNPHYQEAATHANPNPWDNAPSVQAPSTVSIPDEVEIADIGEGAAAAMSFACPNPDSTQNDRSKRDVNKLKQCLVSDFYSYNIKSAPKYSPSFEKLKVKPLFLSTFDLKNNFKVVLSNTKKAVTTVVDKNVVQKEETNIIYDTYQRLCRMIKDKDKEIQFALTLKVNKNQAGLFEIMSEVAVINDLKQKWTFKPMDEINTIFRVSSQYLPNVETGLFIRKKPSGEFEDKLYCLPIKTKLQEYEEVFVVLGDDYNDISFTLTSASQTSLIDTRLCWESKGYYYRPLVNGWSKEERTKEYEIFYDLRTYKIFYINSASRIFCLRNKLDPKLYAGWDWIEWKEGDLSMQNDSWKWYFSRGNLTIPDVREIYKRNIRSFKNNDYLKVIYSGIRWGAWYTTKYKNDRNSVMDFAVNEDIDK